MPNIAELISTIQEHTHSILATIDVKDMFFMVPVQPEDQTRFAFTWEGQQDCCLQRRGDLVQERHGDQSQAARAISSQTPTWWTANGVY